MRSMNKIEALYGKLRKFYGHPEGQWQLWCKRPKTLSEKEEILIGAVLTQRTNWKNVTASISELKKTNACSLKKIYELGRRNVAALGKIIRSCGFYKTKSAYLIGLAEFILKKGGVAEFSKLPLMHLRKRLLDLRGIGPETVDSILLYAFEKPIFVIDEYTRRIAEREKLARDFSYENLQKLFQKNIPKRCDLYQDLHALIVIEMQNHKGDQSKRAISRALS